MLFSDLHVRKQQEHAPKDPQGSSPVPVHSLRGLFPPEGSSAEAPEDAGTHPSDRALRKAEGGGPNQRGGGEEGRTGERREQRQQSKV